MGIANQLVRKDGAAITAFEPKKAHEKITKANGLIDTAAKLKDWDTVRAGIDEKVEQQGEFIGWWRETVVGPGKVNSRRPGRIGLEEAETQTGISHQQVSKWASRLQDRSKYSEALFNAAYRKGMAERGQTDQRGASGTGENEWYTPPEYLDLARNVLGEIDLDPASSEEAQRHVQAADYFTKESDGLAQEWIGRVWLNPPYAQPHIANFVSKMVAERRAGRVTAAIMLTHNYTDTAWFHEAGATADAICFMRGRVKFYDSKGNIAAPTQGQAFIYFGDEPTTFCEVFSVIGLCFIPWQGVV